MTSKVCIVGAGAIGGFIGTRLAAAGRAEVSALARGATLQALRQHGWRVHSASGPVQAAAHASDDAAQLGIQDLVIIAVKGPALTQVAQGIAPLLGPQTVMLPAMNVVPLWFCQGLPGFAGQTLHSVDPGGLIAAHISNRHLDLEPVLGNLAAATQMTTISQFGSVSGTNFLQEYKLPSQWVLMGRTIADLEPFANDRRWHPTRRRPDHGAWTDDFSNVLSVVKWPSRK